MPLGFGNATRRAAANTAASGGSGIGLLGGPGGFSASSGEPLGTLLYTFSNPDTHGTTSDQFGSSEIEFSPNGEFLAVGAFQADTSSNTSTGEVHLYDLINESRVWTVEGTHSNEFFGKKVDVSDNYVFVSHERYNAGGYSAVGRVTIYDIFTGNLVATINPSTNSNNRYFGNMICINPDTDQLAVYESSTDTIYIYNSSNYNTVETTISNATGSTSTVTEGEMDGDANYFAIGRAIPDSVRVFDWDGNLETTINPSTSYKFGISVNLNGDYLVVGDNGYTDGNDGAVFVYNTSNWSLNYSKSYVSASSLYGANVDTSPEYMIVGANWVNYGGQYHSGSAYLYDISNGNLETTITPTTAVRNGAFGISTAINRYRYAVGHAGENKIYVYSTGE